MTFEGDLTFSLIKTLFTVCSTLILLFALTDFKYGKKRILTIYGAYLLYVYSVSYLCITLLGWVNFMRSCLITIYLPAFVLTYLVATDHALQAVFHYATQFDIGLILSVTGTLINTGLHGGKAGDLIIRAALFTGVFALEYGFLRHPFRQAADSLQKSWGFLAAVPVCFGILFLACGLFPVHFTENPWAIIQVYLAALVMAVSYVVVFRSLMDSCALSETARQRDILAAQAAALEKHTETLMLEAEQEAVFRNNIDFYRQTIHALLMNGDTKRALEYLGDLNMEYDTAEPEEYCHNTVLNDILSYYIGRARKQGIEVFTSLYFPPALPVDAVELATVFVNAIENAMETMKPLPNGSRRLMLISTDKPRFAIEIANTCPEHMAFDSDGLPLDTDNERNIRTRSILAFADSHNSYLDCEVKDNTFHLRLLIKAGDSSPTT